MLIAEDLEQAQNNGVLVTDSSLPDNDPRKIFTCRSTLLYSVGDYPAQGKVSGFTHAGKAPCHWCAAQFPKCGGLHRVHCGNHRKWLSDGHAAREPGVSRAAERSPPPPARTNSDVIRTGTRAANWAGSKASFGRFVTQTGIKFWCPLQILDNFDMCLDFPMDMMHLVHWVRDQLFAVLRGSTVLSSPDLYNLSLEKSAEEKARRARVNRARVRRHRNCREVYLQ